MKVPFVSRKRYRRSIAERDAARAAVAEQGADLQRELRVMQDTLLRLPGSFANRARIAWLKPPPENSATRELCLFVTHAATAQIKLHVADHVQELIAAGIAVVLIANTDLDPALIQLPPTLLAGLHGFAVRENTGFDFGAWAHVYSLLDTGGLDRLFLVNDSIVGPLDPAAFSSVIGRIRAKDADMIGLTQNPYPKWHLQSFFLVFNKTLLASPVFDELMRHVVNLPTKEAVINTYEIQITAFLMSRHFRCEPLFALLEPGSDLPDDSYFRWSQLVESGFPFIKASILRGVRADPKAIELIPAQYRDAARP
jgi:lipopolysaccharide biosynthesis protein